MNYLNKIFDLAFKKGFVMFSGSNRNDETFVEFKEDKSKPKWFQVFINKGNLNGPFELRYRKDYAKRKVTLIQELSFGELIGKINELF